MKNTYQFSEAAENMMAGTDQDFESELADAADEWLA